MLSISSNSDQQIVVVLESSISFGWKTNYGRGLVLVYLGQIQGQMQRQKNVKTFKSVPKTHPKVKITFKPPRTTKTPKTSHLFLNHPARWLCCPPWPLPPQRSWPKLTTVKNIKFGLIKSTPEVMVGLKC